MKNETYVIHTVNKFPSKTPIQYWGKGRWGDLKNANAYKTTESALRIIRRMFEAGLWTPMTVSLSFRSSAETRLSS